MKIKRLPKSEWSDSQVKMVNGADIAFLEYVDITLLLGCPFMDLYDAVPRIKTGEFTIHDLNVILPLKKSNSTSEQYTIINRFDVTRIVHSTAPAMTAIEILATPSRQSTLQQFSNQIKDDYSVNDMLKEFVAASYINASFVREDLA